MKTTEQANTELLKAAKEAANVLAVWARDHSSRCDCHSCETMRRLEEAIDRVKAEQE